MNLIHVRLEASLVYGGLLGLLVMLLGMNVSRMRGKLGIGISTETTPELLRAVRAHGNAAEWVPLGLFLLLALEVFGAGTRFSLHLAGGTFFLARLLHAVGTLGGSKLSVAGAALNYAAIGTMSIWAFLNRF